MRKKDENDEDRSPNVDCSKESNALKMAELMLSLGGSPSEVSDHLRENGCAEPLAIITKAVARWMGEDKELSSSRRAIQRRRLMRQIRLAMDESKVGDAVRAEAILARLDDQEAEIEAGKISDEFQDQLQARSEEDIQFYIDNERWPTDDDKKPQPTDESVH